VNVLQQRVGVIFALFLALLALAATRTAYLGVVRSGALRKAASTQQLTEEKVMPPRGTITDRNGVELAVSEPARDISADPYLLSSPLSAAQRLAPLLGQSEAKVLRKLSQRTGFVYLARALPGQQAQRILELKIPGVAGTPVMRRVYPRGTLAAQVLGVVGTEGGGLTGLEYSRNAALGGKSGIRRVVSDAIGQPVSISESRPEVLGQSLQLTLDANIQQRTEDVLGAVARVFNPKDATAIVMDPRTGAILAMAQEPGYNANGFPGAFAHGLTVDHAINDVYEPGSVFKVVTISGALSQHDITPNSVFAVPGSLRVSDRVIHDAESHGTERLHVWQILQRSSNIGTDEIAGQYLHEDGLKYWMHRFGFGRRTGIGFPGESRGIMPSYWSGSTIGTVPIGQGVSVTGIQLASAYAAIANNGLWLQPHLVDHVVGEAPPKLKSRRVLTPRIDSQLRTMLRGVVSDQGTAVAASIPGYSVAGKTGTAQKPGPYGYLAGKYMATFVGMVPASKPRLVVLVSVDEPQGEIYGGLVAAPAFQQIASFDLQDLQIPPDRPIH
jgi:cell division protein FtsI/penicillin-binding protein 2